MSIYSQTITLAGRQVLLVLVEPNWDRPVEITSRITVDAAVGVTGIQERRPEHSAPRWHLKYRALSGDAALQQLRSVAALADTMLVAMPHWPDVQRGDDGTDITGLTVYGQCNAGWDDGFAGVVATDDSSLPARKFRGALIVGRATFRFTSVTDAMAEVDIDLREDSPWSMRLEPAANAPLAWDEDWQPDWSTAPLQDLLTLNDWADVGLGRERLQTGDAGAQRWRQSATWLMHGDDAADVLAFWAAKSAGHEAFTVPSLLQPGVVLPGAPHQFDAASGRVVFAGDVRWRWITPDLAEVRFAVEQQIETPSVDQQPAGVAYLYHFTYGVQSARITDWESPITAGGHTYQPARIEHDRIRNTLKPQQEECQIKVALDDLPLAAPFLRLEMEGKLNLTVQMMELPSGTPQTLFVGSVASARAKQSLLTLKVSAFGGALARKLPRFAYSHRCNHTLFSFGCQRRRPSEMSESAWMYSGVIAYQWDQNAPRVVLSAFTAPSGKPATLSSLQGYFAGGWLEIGWDTPHRQVREITWSGTHTVSGDPDRLFLDMHRVLRGDVSGVPVRLWPGCDGRLETCVGKFSNSDNFGGFPHQPAWIEQASMGAPKGGK